jgi:hypothetical protein
MRILGLPDGFECEAVLQTQLQLVLYWLRTRLPDPVHLFAAANPEYASFNSNGVGIEIDKVGRKEFSAVDVVYLPGPSVRTVRAHAHEDRNTNKRTISF